MLMKKLNFNQIKKTLIITTACTSMSVFAEEATVWKDRAGDVTKDGAGDCLHTIWWQKDSSCGNEDSSVAEQKAETKAEPAPAPASAPAPAAKPQYAKVSLSSAAAFELSGYELSDEGKAEVKAFAAKLEGHDVDKITVEGYTDSTGDAAFNQDLSEKRAQAVKDEMVKNGVDASLITVIGHGENDPIADNNTREGRAKNRRVTVEVEGNKTVQQ
jgi:outer membrane protein OmpA-like peptidoglycan-associated protein